MEEIFTITCQVLHQNLHIILIFNLQQYKTSLPGEGMQTYIHTRHELLDL